MSNNSYVHIHELRRIRSIVKRFRDWRRWKLCLPLIAIGATYFCYKFFASGEEFVTVFGHGDVLFLSSLILLEFSVEASHMNNDLERTPPDNIDSLIENSRFFGVVLILLYAAMKLMVEHRAKLNQIPLSRLEAFCILSISITFLVVCFTFFAFWQTLSQIIGTQDDEDWS
jgi:hypothetical protein